MKIAIIGGTHGNEPVGIEVINHIKTLNELDFSHSFETFLGNPKAYEQKCRFIHTDLNRCFGTNPTLKGHEAGRSHNLKEQIEGKFDFIIDLHTATSNMGLTIILNNDDQLSLNAACFLKRKYPEITLIKSKILNEKAPYTNAMAKSGLTVEVGSVASNVIKASLVIAVKKMVLDLLNWDLSEEESVNTVEYYQMIGPISFPQSCEWMIHPSLEDMAFNPIKKGDPLFINILEEVIPYEDENTIYPFFINEEAYQTDRIAMVASTKEVGL